MQEQLEQKQKQKQHQRTGDDEDGGSESGSLMAGAKFTKLPCNTLEIAKVFHYSLCGCSRVVE